MQDVVLELETHEISDKDGVNKTLNRLNKFHRKDDLRQKYNLSQAFETYERRSKSTVRDFLT